MNPTRNWNYWLEMIELRKVMLYFKAMMKAFTPTSKAYICIKWVQYIIIEILSLVFLIFGADTLIGSYSLKNPMEFIMYFFSSSLIILISLVGIIYPIFQIHAFLNPPDHRWILPPWLWQLEWTSKFFSLYFLRLCFLYFHVHYVRYHMTSKKEFSQLPWETDCVSLCSRDI